MASTSQVRGGWLVGALMAALCVCSVARAQPLDLAGLDGQVDLADRVALLRDPEGKLSFADVRARAFSVHDGTPLSFGFNHDTMWLRFSARNDVSESAYWLLEVAEPTIEYLDLYVVHRDGASEHLQGGVALPFASRKVRHPNFVLELRNPAHDVADYYVRVRSDAVLRAPLHAWTPLAYAEHHENDVWLRALSLGALVLVALYHLGLFALVRQVESAWYAFVALALAGVLMSLGGQFAQFLAPNQTWLVLRSPGLTISLAIVTLAFFTYAAVQQLKTHVPLARLLLKVAFSTLGLLALALAGPPGLVLRVEMGILLGICVAGPYILWAVRTYQIPEMRLYSVAWYALIVTVPVAVLRYGAVWPDGPFSEWALPAGFVAYGVANSLALASLASRLRGELRAMNVTLLDNVQELQQALVRAEEATEQAQRATKSKDEFVATMSHELRTPLNAIINIPQGLIGEFVTVRGAECSHCQAAYLLDDGDVIAPDTECESCHRLGKLVEGQKVRYRGDEARCLRFLQKIERSGQHLLQMVNGVLDYSKLEAGRFELTLGPIDVEALLREVGDQMVDIAQRKNIRIDVVVSPSGEQRMMADVLRLKQVLINLLANAIKFSEHDSQVSLRWSSSSDGEQIEVEDRGIGIANVDQERIFTSFEQVHKGDTRKYGGTGLGLSISRSLVRMHGGELSVRSELGKGSTFIVRMPRIANTVAHPSREFHAIPENTNAHPLSAAR